MTLLTLARDLRRRRGRERRGLFVAEGVRAVRELLRSPLEVRGVLASPSAESSAEAAELVAAATARALPVLRVDEAEFASAADTDSPQGLLAIAVVPDRTVTTLSIPPRARLLVLDAVQDPGNAGTLIRTAAALGAVATLALPGTVDLWNAKVIRGSMGTHFLHHALPCSYAELDALIERERFELWGADMAGEQVGRTPPPDRLAIAVGNEGHGLTPELRSRMHRLVSLPIAPSVESLNVAVAAGILLHELRA